MGIVVLVELCRRCVGLPIIIVAGCLVIYAFYWQATSGAVFDAVGALRKVVQKLFYTTSGVIGTPINVCYTYIILFVIFGAFLERTGIANFFISLANRIAAGRAAARPKVAVISSALVRHGVRVFGGQHGHHRHGHHPHDEEDRLQARIRRRRGGGVVVGRADHAPIMGAAAFLMAEYMGIPYMEVAAKAIVPGASVLRGHLHCRALGGEEAGPQGRFPLRAAFHKLSSQELLSGAAAGASGVAGVLGRAHHGGERGHLHCGRVPHRVHQLPHHELEPPREGETFGAVFVETCKVAFFTAVDAFASGARNAIAVAVACAMAGLIAGSITVTGLASTIINVIVMAAGDMIIVGLVFTMICCLILGMGVPTTANYCIMASTCAPILMQLGIDPICAHFFVFYFGIAADITPPVALAAYAASAIAKSRPMATAVNAPSWASPSSWCPTYSHSVPFCSWWATT